MTLVSNQSFSQIQFPVCTEPRPADALTSVTGATPEPVVTPVVTPGAELALDACSASPLPAHTQAPNQVKFGTSTPTPAFTPDYRRAETVLLASKYLSDNPETVVQKGSGVLAPERELPTAGVSRVSFYHSFVTPDAKQAYVTVSAGTGGSFYLRGQGASVKDPLNASLEANQAYAKHKPLTVAIINAKGDKRSVELGFDPDTQRYLPKLELTAGERAFIPVGAQIPGKAIADDAQLEQAHKAASNTLVGHLDLEPAGGTTLSAGTYVEGQEKHKDDQSLKKTDYDRVRNHREGDYIQSPITGGETQVYYGNYQGEQPGKGDFSTGIKPHHSVYVQLDPSGVIPYDPSDIGKDKSTGVSFVRLIGTRDGAAQVDADLDGKSNEAGELVYSETGTDSRLKGTSNYEASVGFISRKTPGTPTMGKEGDKDGYGLPYQLPNQLFDTGKGSPDNKAVISDGRLILRGDPPQGSYKCKYAVTVLDADNKPHQILIGGSKDGPIATRDNFWTIDLKQHPIKLPVRIITHEGSDLGLQVYYDPPGGDDLKARAKLSDPKDKNSPLVMPAMTE